MADLTADFELGTNGSTILTGDAGSADAWNIASTPPAGGVMAYDTAHAAHGTKGAQFSTGGTAGAIVVTWSTALGTVTDHYGRVYVYFTANPSTQIRIIRTASTGTAAASIEINTTGKIRMLDSASVVQATLTNAISLNAWVRIEYHFIHSATVGQIEIKLFNTPDSTSATETLATAATLNTLASANRIAFGSNISSANVGPFWMDDILGGATAYPGPAVTSGIQKTGMALMDG